MLQITIERVGYDILDSLGNSGKIKELKITVFTAASISDDEIKKLEDKGVTSFLIKPVKSEVLLSMLNGSEKI